MILVPHLPQLPDVRRYARALALVFVVFYLGFHAVSGERGVVAWIKEARKLEALEVELAELQSQREALEHKVKLLSASSIDPDMLDEQSRRVLGFARPDEVVILNP